MNNFSDNSANFYDKGNILRHLKVNSIIQAKELGIEVYTIKCRSRTNALQKLHENVTLWISKENVLIDEVNTSETYTYGGASYNGRTLQGRKRKNTKFFSNFKICKETDDGYIEHFSFQKLSKSDLDKYENHSNFNIQNSPSMLQIVYGLMRKYDDVIEEVRGVMPEVY